MHAAQLSILNAASFVGRVVPGFFAHSFGVMNMVIACAASCTVLIFAMLGVKTVAGVSVFATLFGFFSGACMSFAYFDLFSEALLIWEQI